MSDNGRIKTTDRDFWSIQQARCTGLAVSVAGVGIRAWRMKEAFEGWPGSGGAAVDVLSRCSITLTQAQCAARLARKFGLWWLESMVVCFCALYGGTCTVQSTKYLYYYPGALALLGARRAGARAESGADRAPPDAVRIIVLPDLAVAPSNQLAHANERPKRKECRRPSLCVRQTGKGMTRWRLGVPACLNRRPPFPTPSSSSPPSTGRRTSLLTASPASPT